MSNSAPLPNDDVSGDINVKAGRDVEIGGDVVGRDKVKVVHVGYDASAVQRLLLTMGGLLLATAACFFSGGVATGGAIGVLLTFQPASPEAAQAMQNKINYLENQPPGAPFQETFTAEELNSYVKYIAGPQLGFVPESGQARILDSGEVAVGGQMAALGNLRVVVVFDPQTGLTPEPLQLKSAAVEVLPCNNSIFGWVMIPPALLPASLTASANQALAGVEFHSIQVSPEAINVSGVGR